MSKIIQESGDDPFMTQIEIFNIWVILQHSLIRGVIILSCSTGAKNFTNNVFCHVQFSGVIPNIENLCAIRAKF